MAVELPESERSVDRTAPPADTDVATDAAGHGTDAWLYGWALGYAAVGAASLLVPLYAIDFGAGAVVVSLITATAALAGVPGAILWGKLVAKTHRRRPFVLVALALTAGTFLVLPFLAPPWTVLAANAVLWFVIAAAATYVAGGIRAGVAGPAGDGAAESRE